MPTTSPTTRHPDPAVQMLIDGAWLGVWDEPITVDDLVQAVRLIRQVDLRATGKLIRTEWRTGESRDVWRLPDGAELTTAWKHVRDGRTEG